MYLIQIFQIQKDKRNLKVNKNSLYIHLITQVLPKEKEKTDAQKPP